MLMVSTFYKELNAQIKNVEQKAVDLAPQMISELLKSITIRQIARRCKRSTGYINRILNKTTLCDMGTFEAIEIMYYETTDS